jgi:beta-galactosidase
MKKLLGVAVAVCIGLLANLAVAGTRSSEPINRDWSFTLGDPKEAQAVDHDTAKWRRVDLPHSFSPPYFLGTGFYTGARSPRPRAGARPTLLVQAPACRSSGS